MLTDSLMMLWGFVRGAFGVHVSLARGVVQLPGVRPAPGLEGAEYCFVVKGEPVKLRVQDGKTVVEEGGMCVYQP